MEEKILFPVSAESKSRVKFCLSAVESFVMELNTGPRFGVSGGGLGECPQCCSSQAFGGRLAALLSC